MNEPRATAPQCDQFCFGPVTEMFSQKIWLNLEFQSYWCFFFCFFGLSFLVKRSQVVKFYKTWGISLQAWWSKGWIIERTSMGRMGTTFMVPLLPNLLVYCLTALKNNGPKTQNPRLQLGWVIAPRDVPMGFFFQQNPRWLKNKMAMTKQIWFSIYDPLLKWSTKSLVEIAAFVTEYSETMIMDRRKKTLQSVSTLINRQQNVIIGYA